MISRQSTSLRKKTEKNKSSSKEKKTGKAPKREPPIASSHKNEFSSPVHKMPKVFNTHINNKVDDEDVHFVITRSEQSALGVGFYNPSNCCYINSVLQLLFTIQPHDLFPEDEHPQHSPINNELRSIHSEYILSAPGNTLHVLSLMRALCNNDDTFQLNQQSDAFEFLNVLCQYVGTSLFDSENVTTILRSCCGPSVTTQPIQHIVHLDIDRIDNNWEELISSSTEIEYTCDICSLDCGNNVIKTHTTHFNSQYAIVVLKIYSQDQYGDLIKLKPNFLSIILLKTMILLTKLKLLFFIMVII